MHGTCSPAVDVTGRQATCRKTSCLCDPNTPDGPADALSTGFDLYISTDGHWRFYMEGGQTGPDDPANPPIAAVNPFSVTAACIPWSALGVASPPQVVRVDDAFVSRDEGQAGQLQQISPSLSTLPSTGQVCVLSSAMDDYAHGSAKVSTGELEVYAKDWLWPSGAHGSEFLWSSATCFGQLTYEDLPPGSLLPSNAFCGLSQFGEMAAPDSVAGVSGSAVIATHATATARCFPMLSPAMTRDGGTPS
jgi:hypothetical protein